MSRIKYINSKKFFAKEYKDGIIVAFKNIGDNNTIYADQIHQIVSKYLGVDLFASDISESISCTENHKGSIKDSLFVYTKNGVSISAWRINICLNKYGIDVKYNSEDVLTIKNNVLKIWQLCILILKLSILILICIWGYNIIFDDDQTINAQEVESQKETPINPSIPKISTDTLEIEPTIPVNDSDENIIEEIDTISIQNDYSKNKVTEVPTIPNVESPTSVKCHKLEYYHAVEAKVQREREDAERDRQRKAMKAEANEYVRIADQAYNDYAGSFNEGKGIVALTNYKKALDLNKKHSLFFVSERERIEQKVNILEKEINIY